ncbi:tetraspanin 37 [Notothenia coriiceps]|uniref:Tetraspanin n=1 Tax=Notothenia coriiceps TaxID=8208 RepID=A0A6I9PHD4_9TELE|nr:PREDICTED: tetraspanin-3-like [Notothenia coriiceps]
MYVEILCLFLHQVVGLVVGMSGVYLLMKYKQSSVFLSQSYFPLPAFLALASAVLILACGGLGSCLSIEIRDSTFLQGLFVYLLVLVFCLESTASALAFFHTTKLESELTPLSGVFHNYTGRDPDSQAVDATQAELQCCGVHDFRDWLETPWFNSTGGLLVPHSCCNSTFLSCKGAVDQPWQLYTQGCQVKLEKSLQFVLRFIIWGSPIVFFVEVRKTALPFSAYLL